MGFVLFIVALFLTTVLTFVSMVVTPIYYIATFKWQTGLGELNKWFYKLALSIDQFGNVSCGRTLQITLTKPVAHQFGNEDDTVSYVIAKNRDLGTLTVLGKVIGWVLDKLDKDHLNKAIEYKRLSDIEACKRINE
jgi:hypothetical protein